MVSIPKVLTNKVRLTGYVDFIGSCGISGKKGTARNDPWMLKIDPAESAPSPVLLLLLVVVVFVDSARGSSGFLFRRHLILSNVAWLSLL